MTRAVIEMVWMFTACFRAVVLKQEQFCPWGHWQCLETVLTVTNGDWEGLLTFTGERSGMLLNVLTARDSLPQQGIFQPPKSTMLRLRNPDAEQQVSNHTGHKVYMKTLHAGFWIPPPETLFQVV